MSVYFVKPIGMSGPIKIGFAADFEVRFQSLQTGSPIPLEALRVIEGTQQTELALHRKFAAHRLHGEWFEPCAELLAFIDQPTEIQMTGNLAENTHASLIRSIGIAEFAALIGVPYSHANTMVSRNSIPLDFWPALAAALPEMSMNALLDMRLNRASPNGFGGRA